MIYDYCDIKNSVSIWMGNCKSYEALDEYLSTVYLDENEEDQINNVFLAANKNRPCEQELKEAFTEYYNQFEYDFGVSFDEDFREAAVYDEQSDDLDALLGGFSAYESFIDGVKKLTHDAPLKSYNAVVILYDFKYDGNVSGVKQSNLELEFIGHFDFHW